MRRACSGRDLFGHAQIYWLHAQAWLAPEVASPFGVRSPFFWRRRSGTEGPGIDKGCLHVGCLGAGRGK